MPRSGWHFSDDDDPSAYFSSPPRVGRSQSRPRSKRLSLGLRILSLFSPRTRTVSVVHDRSERRQREQAYFRAPNSTVPDPSPSRSASSMSPPRRAWVPLPPKIPVTPPPKQQKKPFHDYSHHSDEASSEDDTDYEVRTPIWAPPGLNPRPSHRDSHQPRLRKRPRNPFDEPEVIEVTPDTVRPIEEQNLRAEQQAWHERQERFRIEQEAQMQYDQALAAHNKYQTTLHGHAYRSHQVEMENRRLRDERDQALQRLKLAEIEANQARRANDLKQRQDRLDTEARQPRQPRPAPLLFQEPRGPVREPGLDALHRAQQDAARKRQDEELRQRNRDRNGARGTRKGSPVIWDDLDARRNRRR